MKYRLLLLITLLASAGFPPLPARDVLLPEEEAPATLFSIPLEDEAVDFFMTGSWDLSLSGGLGMGISSTRGVLPGVSFPGFATAPLFSQLPDVTVSLWYDDRYFFETSVTDELDESLFLLGYEGREDDFLRRLRIGNHSVELPASGPLAVPEAPLNSLGISARMQGAEWTHDLLLRFDPGEKERAVFIGERRLLEIVWEPAEYLRRRFYALPDGNVTGLEVLLEAKSSGGSSSYWPATSAELAVDAKRGVLLFKERQEGRVLLRYDGADTTGREIVFDGRSYLLLQDYGEISPYEMEGFYAAAVGLSPQGYASGSERLWLHRTGEAPEAGTPLPFSYYSDQDALCIADLNGDREAAPFQYPLTATLPGIYGAAAQHDGGGSSYALTLQVLESAGGYQLESPIPGSVEIRINGREQSGGWFLNEEGAVEFLFPLFATDRIEILYTSRNSSQQGGTLTAASGNQAELSPGLSANWGALLSWDLINATYTAGSETAQGVLELSGGLEYQSGPLSWTLDAGLSMTTPDTTGYHRALGMEESGRAVLIRENRIFPAPLPLHDATPLSENNRGTLYYDDYHYYSSAGTALIQDYTWSGIPDDQVYPYSDGGRIGPYCAAAGSDGRAGKIMVLDYTLQPDEWAGALITLQSGSAAEDLREMTALTFSWKITGGSWNSDLTAVLDMGRLGEDLDGDDTLDTKESSYGRGLPFNTTIGGQPSQLYAGGWDRGAAESEDRDGSGYLTGEAADGTGLISVPLTGSGDPADAYPDPGASWQQVRIPLTPAMRRHLSSVSGIRLYIVNAAAGATAEGRLLVSDFFLEGSPFASGSAQVETTYEGYLPETEKPAQGLVQAFPEIATRFHPDGGAQKILRIACTDGLEITAYPPPVELDNYGKLGFYMRTPGVSGASLELFAGNGSGHGVRAVWSPGADDDWAYWEIDWREGRLTKNGAAVSGAAVSTNGEAVEISRITLKQNGSSTGIIFIDEIHLLDPVFQTGAGGRGRIAWESPGPLLSAGPWTLIGQTAVTLDLRGSGALDSRLGELENSGSASLEGESSLTTSLAGLDLQTSLDAALTGGRFSYRGAHSLSLPLFEKTLQLSNSYALRESPGQRFYTNENELRFRPGEAFSLLLKQGSKYGDTGFSQSWEGSLSAGAGSRFSLKMKTLWQQSRTSPPENPGSYLVQWLRSQAHLLPFTGSGARSRYISAGAEAGVGTETLKATLKAEGDTSYRGSGETVNTAYVEAALPLHLAAETADAVEVETGYSRRLQLEGTWSSRSLREDFAGSWHRLAADPLLFRTLPLAELFAPAPYTPFYDYYSSGGAGQALYRARWFVSASRRSGSRLWDLFTPSALEVALTRSASTAYTSQDSPRTISAALRFSALNLFGRLGAYSLTEIYRTDEFGGSLTFTLPEEGAESWSGEWALKALFIGEGYENLRLSNNLKLDRGGDIPWQNRGILSWSRKRIPETPWDIPLLTAEEEARQFFLHTEALEYGLAPSQSSLTLRHDTELKIPFRGNLTLFAALGWQLVPSAGEAIHYVGFQCGIEARIIF